MNIPTSADDFNELDEITHTITCPDVYMGALKTTTKELYTFDGQNVKLERVTYNTGLLKIFDEILTNASDNLQRQHSNIRNIMVNITDDSITVFNDGQTIPIEQNSSGVWIPEMIFTHFRSGSNFKRKNKTTGGKNGIGAKLTSVFSTEFIVEITSGDKHYHQVVTNNCRNVQSPTISSNQTHEEDYISITFKPDFNLLKASMTEDNKKVLYKRVHDLTHLPINIYLNDEPLPRLSWDEYVRSFPIGQKMYTYISPRWRVAFGLTSDKHRSISYVNNIATYDGGTHVKYILDQLYNFFRSKCDVAMTAFKSKIFIIVSAVLDDPAFTSQAKEKLSSLPSEFGTTCNIPEQIIDAFIFESNIVELLKPKPSKSTKTKVKRSKITSIEKLDEANKAGTSEGYKCTLFLCEGLSAKTMCDAGISILGHDYYGCYPLRGKVLNTRNASDNKYNNNREITDIKEILGLQDGVEYTTVASLRYGKVVCVKDADADGAAIMGLVINFFESKFPSLLKIPGFFSEFISPMIKVVYNAHDKHKRTVLPFYNEVEYRDFIERIKNNPDGRRFTVEFIKGLATNEDSDINEYFTHYQDNKIEIIFDENYSCWLDMAFNAKRANDRKKWLETITPDTHLPRRKHEPIRVIDFIQSDLVLFSYDDCVRSIPSSVDGLKPSQRKILYTLFKMGNKGFDKMKVFQLGGLVAKKANYHHGDQSMNATIIGMARDYPTSGNNIPLLKPSGQFGSRMENGEDSGAPRYISCSLNKVTRLIFPPIDDSLMEYREEDNQTVEPYHYVPIIPMILVNGAKGIGTGWSTDIPSFNPFDIILYIKNRLLLEETPAIHSWYRGFEGEIFEETDRWNYQGIVKQTNDYTFEIHELPIRYSKAKFVNRLNYLLWIGENGIKPSITEASTATASSKRSTASKRATHSTPSSTRNTKKQTSENEDFEASAKKWKINWSPIYPLAAYNNKSPNVNKVLFTVKFKVPLTVSQVMETLGLTQSIKKTNMVAFNEFNQIEQFDTVHDIIDSWYDLRYELYVKRIQKIIAEIEHELKLLTNKARFIEEHIKKIIDVKNMPKNDIITLLEQRNYDKLPSKSNDGVPDYDYLLNMKIYALTKEKYEELLRKTNDMKLKLEQCKNKTVEEIWFEELEALEQSLKSE